MTPTEHRQLTQALLPAVLAAGRLQLRYQCPELAVRAKADDSPVTIADHESEALLVAALRAVAPDVPVLAEEEVAAGRVPRITGDFFAVDPLDGTKEYLAGNREFTVNVALVQGGLPRYGLIYAPALSGLYVTTRDGSSHYYRLAPDHEVASLAGRRGRRLRARVGEEGALQALTSRSTHNARCSAFLQKAGASVSQKLGSSLKFCLIAKGQADVYARFGPTSEWDTAAGQAILTAAGGRVTTADGETLRYGKAKARYTNPDFIAWGASRSSVQGP